MKSISMFVAVGILFAASSVHAGYLENLLENNNKTKATQHVLQKTEKTVMTDRNITSEEELSRVLLSFEKEAEKKALIKQKIKERLKAEAANRKAEKEKYLAEKAAEEARKSRLTASKNGFPTLEEQMRNFHGKDERVMRPDSIVTTPGGIGVVKQKKVIYGVFCKKGRCYALGDRRIYKEGDTVNGRKIMEIQMNFIRYKDGGKEWYTR